MTRLLVIRFSALGDVAMLVPVVRALAEQYPALEITVLSEQRMAALFDGMPGNVLFHGVDVHRQSLNEITHSLGNYDAVADMHGVWRSLYIRTAQWFKGAKTRTIHKGRFCKFLLTHGIAHKPLRNSSLRYVDVLHGLGLFATASEVPRKEVGNGIGIAPFAAHKGKIYPLYRMEEVLRLLSQEGERIVLFGRGKAEEALLETWAQRYPNVQSVAGKYSLKEELELMRGLRVMLTMDSANMHLASLVGTRVVSIWGATHPNAGFLGVGQQEADCIQRALRCRPCSVYGNKVCKYGDYRCMDIAPEEIAERVSNPTPNCSTEGHRQSD